MKNFRETAIKFISASLVQLLICLLLLGFKSIGFWFFADWSYWAVFSPLWVPPLAIVGLFVVISITKYFASVFKEVNSN